MDRMIGAGLEATYQPTAKWAAEHPGEAPPPEETEVVIRLLGLEMRSTGLVGPNGQPGADQRHVRLLEFARIPLLRWQAAMDKRFDEGPPGPPVIAA